MVILEPVFQLGKCHLLYRHLGCDYAVWMGQNSALSLVIQGDIAMSINIQLTCFPFTKILIFYIETYNEI